MASGGGDSNFTGDDLDFVFGFRLGRLSVFLDTKWENDCRRKEKNNLMEFYFIFRGK